jgi:hypothetical protein
MIKLSDYLDYLNNEIIQARKKLMRMLFLLPKNMPAMSTLNILKCPGMLFPA